MKKHFVVVGIGEMLWDLLPSGKQLGGAPANFIWFAKALGARAYVISSVGNDRLGREILAKFKKMGLDRQYVARDKSHPTGVVAVQVDRHGKPAYDIKGDVAWDFIPFSRKLAGLAKKTDAVCFGSLALRSAVSRHAIRQFVARVPASALKIFDINLRQSFYDRQMIARLFGLANVLKINADELRAVARMFALRGRESAQVRELMRRYGLRVVAVTKGPRGATLYSPEGVCASKGRRVCVVDTVGAGDSFTAALVMGLLRQKPAGAILESANCLAGYVCSRAGATPVLPAGLRRAFRPAE